jgi:hypothetical protein
MLEGCKTDPNMANVKQEDIHKIFSNLPSILPLNRDHFLAGNGIETRLGFLLIFLLNTADGDFIDLFYPLSSFTDS